MFAHETVHELRRSAKENPAFPPILFVQQGTVAQGDDFFSKEWPEARAIADPTQQLYRDFGLARISKGEILRPGVIACGIRAAMKGNRGGKTVGDPQQMPGIFAFEGDQLVWQHDFRNIGDNPPFAEIPTRIDQATAFS